MDASKLVVRVVPQQGLALGNAPSDVAAAYPASPFHSSSLDPSPDFWRRHGSQMGPVWRAGLDGPDCLCCWLDVHPVEPMVLSVPVSHDEYDEGR
jgi:hypothetical protein